MYFCWKTTLANLIYFIHILGINNNAECNFLLLEAYKESGYITQL